MDDTILRKKLADDQDEKKKQSQRKAILIIIALLFFSGIAIFSMILENKESKWEILNTSSSKISRTYSVITGNFSNSLNPNAKSSSFNDDGKIPIYIVGEIKKPGIYRIIPGTFLYEVVELAGGLTKNAASESINLVFKIDQNQMIRIPSIQDVKNDRLGGVADGLILNEENGFDGTSTGKGGTTKKININTANETELDSLPGIGLATAKLIVDFRTKNGKFKTIEEIMKIPGIKESRFSQIKDLISV